jgi:hypothetical protein
VLPIDACCILSWQCPQVVFAVIYDKIMPDKFLLGDEQNFNGGDKCAKRREGTGIPLHTGFCVKVI